MHRGALSVSAILPVIFFLSICTWQLFFPELVAHSRERVDNLENVREILPCYLQSPGVLCFAVLKQLVQSCSACT